MELNTIDTTVTKEIRLDGSILMRSTIPLEPTAHRLTSHLAHWAKVRAGKVFLAQRSTKTNQSGKWESNTYADVFEKVKHIS